MGQERRGWESDSGSPTNHMGINNPDKTNTSAEEGNYLGEHGTKGAYGRDHEPVVPSLRFPLIRKVYGLFQFFKKLNMNYTFSHSC